MAVLSSRVILGVTLIVIVIGIIGYYIGYYTATQRATMITSTPTSTVVTPKKVEVKAIRIGFEEYELTRRTLSSVIASELKKLFPEVEVSIYPVSESQRVLSLELFELFAKGNLELVFTETTFLDLAWKREFPFYMLPPNARLPVHTLALYPVARCIATTPELKDKFGIKTWRDLDGKYILIIPGPRPPGVSPEWEEATYWLMKDAFKILGIELRMFVSGGPPIKPEEDPVRKFADEVADILRRGEAPPIRNVVAIEILIGAGELSPVVLELLTRMDLVIINPSPEDAEKIIKAGLPFDWIPVTAVNWTKPVGVDRMFCLRDWVGLATSPDVLPEDFVYKMLKNLIANRDKLLKQHKHFKEFAQDPIGVQVKAISSAPHVPVHPGLAKLLKEHGVWRPEWKIAKG
jgi:hypothetical protein